MLVHATAQLIRTKQLRLTRRNNANNFSVKESVPNETNCFSRCVFGFRNVLGGVPFKCILHVNKHISGVSKMKHRIFSISTLAVFALSLGMIGCASKKTKQEVDKTVSAGTAKTADKKADKKGTAPTKTAAASAPAEGQDNYTCTSGDVKRELKVVQTAERCTAEYTKDGTTQEIATGSAGSKYCGEVVERVKGHLVAAGYNCQ
jgi:hypothetical protein